MAADDLINALARAGLYEMLRMRLVRPIAIPAPTVGTDWDTVVPGGVIWEVLSIDAQFATSAVVANRNSMLRFRDPDLNEIGRIGPAAVQAASGTNTYNYFPGLGYTANIGRAQMGLPSPPQVLPAGWHLGVVTSAIDVGDQWSLILITVREWSAQQVAAHAKWIGRQLPSTILLDEGGS